MSRLADPTSRRTTRLLIGTGLALILVAVIAAFWPRSVTFDGVRRWCSPQVGDFVPSDPGPGYPRGLDVECGNRSQPERITMLVSATTGIVIGGFGLELRRRRRPVLRWTAPPNWPAAPEGWFPPAGWVPPPEWPPPPLDWQWWQPLPDRGGDKDQPK